MSLLAINIEGLPKCVIQGLVRFRKSGCLSAFRFINSNDVFKVAGPLNFRMLKSPQFPLALATRRTRTRTCTRTAGQEKILDVVELRRTWY